MMATRCPVPPSLDGFVANFCTASPQVPSQAQSTGRTTMTQPNVYWTLTAPFVTFIGLYTNVPQGGQLDDTQVTWLQSELTAAPPDRAVVLTMHHPPISSDSFHGGSAYMFDLIEQVRAQVGPHPRPGARRPRPQLPAVHPHPCPGRRNWQIPYIVAGSGGYWHLHTMAADAKAAPLPWTLPGHDDISLDAWVDDRHGFLRMTATPTQLSATFFTVPRPQEPWGDPPAATDSFTLNRATHTVT